MAISPVTLDDLTWTDLTAAARQRIPAASNGRWTLHAPVDPGVTLVELHAWLLEQRLYWMDQTPDALTRGALTLLGEAAREAVCATTVLHFPTNKTVRLAAGAAAQLRDSDPPLIFTTQTAVTLLPVAGIPGGYPCRAHSSTSSSTASTAPTIWPPAERFAYFSPPAPRSRSRCGWPSAWRLHRLETG
jgi:hypothetical protein